jgi:uncharacterized protein with HEPN domain
MHDQLTKRLLDAHAACVNIESFRAGNTLDDFSANFRLRLEIERLLEIVGEALRKAEDYDPNLDQRIPELRSAIGMRNRIIHGYDGIDYELIWLTASLRIPELRARIEGLLDF